MRHVAGLPADRWRVHEDSTVTANGRLAIAAWIVGKTNARNCLEAGTAHQAGGIARVVRGADETYGCVTRTEPPLCRYLAPRGWHTTPA